MGSEVLLVILGKADKICNQAKVTEMKLHCSDVSTLEKTEDSVGVRRG
jgi:hypothetical protein